MMSHHKQFFDDLFEKLKTCKKEYTHIKLDIGLSYNAPFSQVWLEKEPDLVVVGFEPHPDSCRGLLSDAPIFKRQSDHGTPLNKKYLNDRFFLVPVALSNVESPCKMTFYKTNKDVGCSSLFRPVDSSLGTFIQDESGVNVLSLKHFFDLFPFDRFDSIDYIKIDAQGSDLDILKSAGSYLQDRVVYITAEPECDAYGDVYDNCRKNSCHNIESYLHSQGFVRVHHPLTQDPTFFNLNPRFQHLKDQIFIYQTG